VTGRPLQRNRRGPVGKIAQVRASIATPWPQDEEVSRIEPLGRPTLANVGLLSRYGSVGEICDCSESGPSRFAVTV